MASRSFTAWIFQGPGRLHILIPYLVGSYFLGIPTTYGFHWLSEQQNKCMVD